MHKDGKPKNRRCCGPHVHILIWEQGTAGCSHYTWESSCFR